MLPNRALTAFRIPYRQGLRQIHSTTRHLAEEAAPAASSTPARRGRKARSTLISNEVSKLQQGPPPPAETPSAPTTSTGFLDTPPPPEAPGRMGQNEPAEREGIAAQGVARPSAMTEPAEGGKDVMAASAPGKADVAVRPQRRSNLPKAAGRAYVPVGFTKKELLRSGEGTATIAGKNFAGVLEDRVHFVVDPGRRGGVNVSEAYTQQKREQGQLVRRLRVEGEKVSKKRNLLSESAREAVVGKLVRGRFDSKGALNGKSEGPLEEIKKKLLLNGTYLGSDARKLVDKVQGFLTKDQWKKLRPAGVKA